jgi:ferritin
MPSDSKFHALLLDQVRSEFTASQQYIDSVRDTVQLALHQEQEVTKQITTLARTARDEGDYLGEQFMQWFLKEQVEEVSSMSTLLTVVDRAGDNLFHIEDFVNRELPPSGTGDPTAPPSAGPRV